jgi:hypothetical protein
LYASTVRTHRGGGGKEKIKGEKTKKEVTCVYDAVKRKELRKIKQTHFKSILRLTLINSLSLSLSEQKL